MRVWDLAVRLSHWAIVALFAGLWWTGETHRNDLHATLGLTMLAVVLFRVLWGLFGSSNARFAGFIKGPAAVLAYLRGLRRSEGAPVAGHNPAGGWSVLALLGFLAAQVTTGLFLVDVDGLESGPLNYLVSYETGDKARGLHHLGFDLLLVLAALHVLAILFYTFVRKDRLVPPMITGRRAMPDGVAAPVMAPLWRALPALLLAMAIAWWVSLGLPTSRAQYEAAVAAEEDY